MNPETEKRDPGRIPVTAEAGPGFTVPKVAIDRGSVNPYIYTDDILDDLEASLSTERLATYVEAASGDRAGALRLYTWNSAVCAAFYEPLQALEVQLRNALCRELAERYGPARFDNPDAGFDRATANRIERTLADLERDGQQQNPSRIVAALSFGFWIGLLGPGGRLAGGGKADYETTLWRPALRRAFPHRRPLTRKQAHGPLDDLRTLRNRIAHHEPVFKRDLVSDHAWILCIAGWISPVMQRWIAHHSRVPAILDCTEAPATVDG